MREKIWRALARLVGWGVLAAVMLVVPLAAAQQPVTGNEVLGPGDVLKITVFQNPDMTTETRVSESGSVTFPLLGAVAVAGMTVIEAEREIADRLEQGGFVVKPQVNVYVVGTFSRQISILGQVGKPGRYPLPNTPIKLVDALALAGGSLGADSVTLMRKRDGKQTKIDIDVPAMFLSGDMTQDIELASGDILFVQRAPTFYAYGEIARPGAYRLERQMTVMQSIALAGGLTLRGTERSIRIFRKTMGNGVERITVKLDDLVQQDDVIYIQESLF